MYISGKLSLVALMFLQFLQFFSCFQIQNKFLLTTQLSVEGPIRMKEEYIEALIEVPKISEETMPEQLKGLIGQAAGALQQLPSPIRDAAAEGLKLPLSKCTWHYTLLAIGWF
jgi:hypothetical protein